MMLELFGHLIDAWIGPAHEGCGGRRERPIQIRRRAAMPEDVRNAYADGRSSGGSRKEV